MCAASACDPYSRDRGSRGGGDDDDGAGSDSDDDDGGGPSWVDSDGDGLSDDQEENLGTDPEDVDTDGDGWEDEEEVDLSTDPLDGDDHPYSMGWPIDPCRDELSVTGNQVGQVTAEFELLSQTGELVRLHDFCGRAVLMVTAAFW